MHFRMSALGTQLLSRHTLIQGSPPTQPQGRAGTVRTPAMHFQEILLNYSMQPVFFFPFSFVALFVIFIISRTKSHISRQVIPHRTPVFSSPSGHQFQSELFSSLYKCWILQAKRELRNGVLPAGMLIGHCLFNSSIKNIKTSSLVFSEKPLQIMALI